jgi:hypothetical protein
MLGTKDMSILSVKGGVGVAQINENFQLHRILTKFGVPGVLRKAIKSYKFQLDRDAALGVQGFSKNPIVGEDRAQWVTGHSDSVAISRK